MCSVRSVEESVLKVFEAVCDDYTRVRVVCGLLCERVKNCVGVKKGNLRKRKHVYF